MKKNEKIKLINDGGAKEIELFSELSKLRTT